MKDSHLVTQSNNLIDARYHEPLTTRQQKVILSIVSMVQPNDEDFKTYDFRIRDFHEMLGLEGDPKYTELKSITQKVLKKSLEITRGEGRFLQVNWFSSIEYFEHEGRIEFSFDPKLKPYLLDLKKAFTSYRLSNILSLKSAYSIRLYELMKKWQNLEVWEFSIDDLKGRFGISKEKYKQYGHFKSRIIIPAVKDLNDKTDVQVTFKEIRKGRKIVKIKFSIKHSKEKEIKVNPTRDEPKKSELNKALFDKLNLLADGYELSLAGFKRIERIAKKIYTKEEYIEQLERLIEFINVENRLGGIDKPVGLMIHIMEDKEKLYNEGYYNPKIENTSSEVVPDWFKDRNKPKEKVEKTKEQLEKEEQDRQEMEAILAKFRERDPETVG